jgi:hypothetical protein
MAVNPKLVSQSPSAPPWPLYFDPLPLRHNLLWSRPTATSKGRVARPINGKKCQKCVSRCWKGLAGATARDKNDRPRTKYWPDLKRNSEFFSRCVDPVEVDTDLGFRVCGLGNSAFSSRCVDPVEVDTNVDTLMHLHTGVGVEQIRDLAVDSGM